MSLFLGNLSPYVRHRELEKVFRRFGRSNLELKDGYGFVVFEEYIDAERALRALRGRSICGERPLISWAKRHRPLNRKGNFFRRRAWDSTDDEHGKRRLSAHDDDKREHEVADASIGSDVKEDDADARQNWENVGIDMLKDVVPWDGGRWGEPLSDASPDHGFGVGEVQDELEIDERENTNGDAYEKFPEGDERETIKGDAHDRSYESLRDKSRAYNSRDFPSSYDHHRGRRDLDVNSQPVCTRCGRLGHVVRYCRSRIRSVHPMDYFDRRNQHRSFRSNVFRGGYRGVHGSRRIFDRERYLARRTTRIGDAVNRRRFHEPVEQSRDRSPIKHHRSGSQERRYSRQSQERTQSRKSLRHSSKSKDANKQKHKKRDKKLLHSKKRWQSSSTSPSSHSPLRASSNSQSRSRSHTPSRSSSSSSSSSQHTLSPSRSRSRSHSSSRSKSSNSPSHSSRSGSHSDSSSRSYSTNSRSAKSLSKSPSCSSRSNSRCISESGSHRRSTSSESLHLVSEYSKKSGSPSKSNAEKRARTSKSREKDEEQAGSGGLSKHFSKVGAITGKKTNLEDSQVKVLERFGAARLWQWESILYRRLERGPVSMENYEKRKQQNEEFGITDKYIRSSSGWWEEVA